MVLAVYSEFKIYYHHSLATAVATTSKSDKALTLHLPKWLTYTTVYLLFINLALHLGQNYFQFFQIFAQ